MAIKEKPPGQCSSFIRFYALLRRQIEENQPYTCRKKQSELRMSHLRALIPPLDLRGMELRP